MSSLVCCYYLTITEKSQVTRLVWLCKCQEWLKKKNRDALAGKKATVYVFLTVYLPVFPKVWL